METVYDGLRHPQNVRGEPKVLKDLESMDNLERAVGNFYNHEPNFTVVSQTK